MTVRLAVTGATGVVGGGVARRLATAGIEQRLVVRSPHRTPALPGAEVAQASYADAPAVRAALAGIDTLFMVSGSEEPNRLAAHLTFVDAAVEAGVRRIVYTSFFHASPDSTFLLARDHWHTEARIRDAGLAFTFLRDNLYADAFLDFAGPEGVIRGPAGNGQVSAVARADVIDAAVAVLLDASKAPHGQTRHDGASYGLTGPMALTLAEIAETITRVTGRRARYQALHGQGTKGFAGQPQQPVAVAACGHACTEHVETRRKRRPHQLTKRIGGRAVHGVFRRRLIDSAPSP